MNVTRIGLDLAKNVFKSTESTAMNVLRSNASAPADKSATTSRSLRLV